VLICCSYQQPASFVLRYIVYMAPHLAVSQHIIIRDMIQNGLLRITDIAKVTSCSTRVVMRIRSNLCCFSTTSAPAKHGGCCQLIISSMLEALCEYLLKKPTLYLDEMVLFLWDQFQVFVTTSTISRALSSAQWSKKAEFRLIRLLPP
jgi:hypothetical protein